MSDPIWPKETLGGLFDIGAGKAMSPSARLGERTYPFLRTANVFWGEVDLTKLDTMNFSEGEIEYKSLKKGDLLVCEGGDIGRSAIWQGEVEKCGFQNHIHRLRPKTPDVVPAFFMYYLQAGFTQLGIYEGAGNKTTIPNLSRGRLAVLEVPKPPKPEQEKIATTLWKVQRAIQVEEKLTATARELKQSAMRQLFTHGLRNEPQKETDFGLIPKSWDVRPLAGSINVTHGFAFKGEFFRDSGPVVLTPGNFKLDGGLYWGTKTKFTAQSCPDEFHFQAGDLVVVMTDLTPSAKLLGSPAFIPAEKVVFHNQRIGKVILTSDVVTKDFLYWLFQTEPFKSYMVKTATGSIIRHTSPGRIRAFPCPIPSPDEQKEIAAILQTIDRKISIHERKRAALSDLFQTLLHELMTAQIRVDKLDIDTREISALC